MNPKRISTAAFAVSVLALAVLYEIHELFSPAPIVVVIQVLAALFMVWARLAFGARSFHAAANATAGGLVTIGPYRFVRHPIYAAVILFSWAGVLSYVSPLGILMRIVITSGMLLRAILEERMVRERDPEHADYARRTRRLNPFVY